MICPKCQGLMAEDSYKGWRGVSCFNCGLCLDPLIEHNKVFQQRASELTAKQTAESLFKK